MAERRLVGALTVPLGRAKVVPPERGVTAGVKVVSLSYAQSDLPWPEMSTQVELGGATAERRLVRLPHLSVWVERSSQAE
ncbi:MAG: hypothetical protein ACOX4B_10020 [Bacillota bacterium]|nr:hypothetical protein [Candidatus Fermentithermobacillaceae bacterium]